MCVFADRPGGREKGGGESRKPYRRGKFILTGSCTYNSVHH